MRPPLRTFRGQLLAVFVPVLALAQLTTWYLVGRFNEHEARHQIDVSLQQAAHSFRRVVADRNAHLRTGARSAARDHQIRQLVSGDDPATLAGVAAAMTPLPVLGVPGWWPDNEVPEFYADTTVFRLPGGAG